MPPCILDPSNADGKKAIDALQLQSIRKALPASVFEKSLTRSLSYMAFDYFIWVSSIVLFWTFSHSATWSTLPFWQQSLVTLVYWNVTGFYMWCLFVVGHDCGHGTFSNNETLNDILGHFIHGSILVPFYPWQLSHRRHHMYHNHIEKDYSHPWYTQETLADPNEWLSNWMHENKVVRFLIPVFGWPLYLFGKPDGSHWIPFQEQRMWRECHSNASSNSNVTSGSSDAPVAAPVKDDNNGRWSEASKCFISLFSVLAYLAFYYTVFGSNIANLLFYYTMPWIVFGWWLVTVTYLQHHTPGTLVYDDKTWKFVPAAFETVDRLYGFGIDYLHHHITDGHVVHHLFFTKIPHYNLPAATDAMVKYLKDNNVDAVYKYENTTDFVVRVHDYCLKHGFISKLADSTKNSQLNENKKKEN